MPSTHIGHMNESTLHEGLKHLYTGPGDEQESLVDGYIVDIRHGNAIIEIQTGGFGNIRAKLTKLLGSHPVLLVHPIAVKKTLYVFDAKRKKVLYKRKSPKRGDIIDIVDQIIYIPEILRHPNFSLEVALTEEEELRSDDGKGSWRRKGISKVDRRLVEVVERVRFNEYRDYLMLLPGDMPPTFTNRELAVMMKKPRPKVGKLTYALKKIGLLKMAGKRGNAQVFEEA